MAVTRKQKFGTVDPPLVAIRRWFIGWWTRTPHVTTGDKSDPVLRRWYVIPRNRYCNVYLHQFVKDDDDRALHDHQWRFFSFILKGSYVEIVKGPDGEYSVSRRRWSLASRPAEHAHRVILARDGEKLVPCTTLCITGPIVRDWGFHCPKGWRRWSEYLDGNYIQKGNSRVSRGCD